MKTLAAAGLKFYKRLISPALPASCRYVPTCSEYAAEAVARHGFFRGLAMATWRVHTTCFPVTAAFAYMAADCRLGLGPGCEK